MAQRVFCIYEGDPPKGSLTLRSGYPCKDHCSLILSADKDIPLQIQHKLVVPKVLRLTLLNLLLPNGVLKNSEMGSPSQLWVMPHPWSTAKITVGMSDGRQEPLALLP